MCVMMIITSGFVHFFFSKITQFIFVIFFAISTSIYTFLFAYISFIILKLNTTSTLYNFGVYTDRRLVVEFRNGSRKKEHLFFVDNAAIFRVHSNTEKDILARMQKMVTFRSVWQNNHRYARLCCIWFCVCNSRGST